ncbi:MAG: hypothetical protein ACFFDF_19185 [Candidatus Odinarchaeota archaeon]
MTKLQMPEDNRLYSPKRAIYLIESYLKRDHIMKDSFLSDKNNFFIPNIPAVLID